MYDEIRVDNGHISVEIVAGVLFFHHMIEILDFSVQSCV